MIEDQSEPRLTKANERVRRAWAKRATGYDRSIGFFERRVFGTDHRAWACSRASGETLEIAVGTGLNLAHYPTGVRLSAIDLSPEMLKIAKERAAELGLEVKLQEADAQKLPFDDASFDTVVCTYSLCNIPDPHLAVGEMKRVLRADGRLVLVDHIRSSASGVLWAQKAVEFVTKRLEGEHMTRRPLRQVEDHGLEIMERERMGRAEVVERLVAVKKP